jgi:hypothetical protein
MALELRGAQLKVGEVDSLATAKVGRGRGTQGCACMGDTQVLPCSAGQASRETTQEPHNMRAPSAACARIAGRLLTLHPAVLASPRPQTPPPCPVPGCDTHLGLCWLEQVTVAGPHTARVQEVGRRRALQLEPATGPALSPDAAVLAASKVRWLR